MPTLAPESLHASLLLLFFGVFGNADCHVHFDIGDPRKSAQHDSMVSAPMSCSNKAPWALHCFENSTPNGMYLMHFQE